ncbi:MAG TPA: TatA/E family twin arginine-targeting protein translocase [Microcoleaceae cyanobacterium]
MNVFGIGLPEMMLILVVALLVFGPKKLPEIGRSLGKALRGFQEASKEFEAEFKREAEHLEKATQVSMEAKLEPPAPSALSPAPESASSATSEAADTSKASSEVAS